MTPTPLVTGKPTNRVLGGCLLVSVLLGLVMCVSVFRGYGPGDRPASTPAVIAPPAAAASALELQSWSWSQAEADSFVEAKGEVKNTSSEPLEHVTAVVTWRAADGTMITSESTLIDYQPILPGQTSPFHVLGTWNPAMKKAGLDFKTLFGASIPWTVKEPKKRKGAT